ncbi:MAG: DUF6492 family protein [Roseiarcus sp.]
MHTVALLTPTYRKDIERFELLSESIDRYVTGYERHYVIVNDDDHALFQRFAGERRVILRASALLPRWLVAVPRMFVKGGRRIWFSFRSLPVHGWHVQQLLKISGALAAREDRICIIDSDNAFFRPFDVGAYAGADSTPLYVDRRAIAADARMHAIWTRRAFELIGLGVPTFPADDYVGNLIVWDKAALRAMTDRIRRATGVDWRVAMCRARGFSEYLIYGHFVANHGEWRERHELVEKSLACAHWDGTSVDASWVEAMVASAEPQQVALCIQSYSKTAVSDIRSATQALAA